MKKFLFTLFAGILGFGCFGNAVDLSLGNSNHLLTVNQGTSTFTYTIPAQSILEIIFTNGSDLQLTYNGNTYPAFGNGYFFFSFLNRSTNDESITFDLINNSSSKKYGQTYDFLYFTGSSLSCPECQECQTCPEINTGEILSGYILESSVDENYCVLNNLCPLNTGDSASWSELVINDIVHQSAPLININIPEEFNWNYAVDENEFSLSISGYNVDTDYIDGIITAQNVKPDSGTLNKIITELIPLFVPGLVIILFIWFVFKFIKKIF